MSSPLEEHTRLFYDALGRYNQTDASRHIKTCTALVANTPLAQGFAALSRFSVSEGMYASYAFLKKNIFKKDSLSLMYTIIIEDLQKVVRDRSIGNVNTPLPAGVNAEYFVDLFQQTCTLINVRQKLISTYRLLAGSPSSLPDYRLLVVSLEVLFDTNRNSFQHPCLTLLRMGFMIETSILICLFKAQLAIGSYEFKDSTALLFKCRGYLDNWRQRCLPTSTPEHAPLSSAVSRSASDVSVTSGGSGGGTANPSLSSTSVGGGNPPPAASSSSKLDVDLAKTAPKTFMWLNELYGMLVAKMTLYFYNVLLSHEIDMGGSASEMRAQFARTDCDYFDLIKVFHRRTEATNVSLLFHVSPSPEEPFHKEGYYVPSTTYEPPTGMNSFQCIFSLPTNTTPAEHKPNIVSIILDKEEDIAVTNSTPFKFHDSRAHATYYIARLDPSVYFVVIYGDKPVSKESSILEFFNSICNLLRSTNLYDKLNRF